MGGVFGAIREETPPYEVVSKGDGFEIRKYGSILVAETAMTGDNRGDAFWTLANYIGVVSAPNNVSTAIAAKLEAAAPEGEKIAMTAPVIMHSEAAKEEQKQETTMTAPEKGGEKIAMTAPVIMHSQQSAQPEGSGPTKMTVMQFVLPSKYALETAPKPTDPRVQIKEVPGKTVAAHVFSGTWNEDQVRIKAEALKAQVEAAGHKPVGTFSAAFYNSPFTIPMFRRNEVWYELAQA